MKTKILASLVVSLSASAKAEDAAPNMEAESLIESMEQAKLNGDISAEEFIRVLEGQGIFVEEGSASLGTTCDQACLD